VGTEYVKIVFSAYILKTCIDLVEPRPKWSTAHYVFIVNLPSIAYIICHL